MPTTEEFLAHHGVKGMKWGKHQAKGDLAITRRRDAKTHEARAKYLGAQEKYYKERAKYEASGRTKVDKVMHKEAKKTWQQIEKTATRTTGRESVKYFFGGVFAQPSIARGFQAETQRRGKPE